MPRGCVECRLADVTTTAQSVFRLLYRSLRRLLSIFFRVVSPFDTKESPHAVTVCSSIRPARVHPDRAAGRHCHHRRVDRLVLPAVQAAREAAAAAQCVNNMKQLGLAIMNYESQVGCLPMGGITSHGKPAQLLVSNRTITMFDLVPPPDGAIGHLQRDQFHAHHGRSRDKKGVKPAAPSTIRLCFADQFVYLPVGLWRRPMFTPRSR